MIMVDGMQFIETDLFFESTNDVISSKIGIESLEIEEGSKSIDESKEIHVLGVRVRIGNRPIVTNLRKLLESIHSTLPPSINVLFKDKEVYTIVHAIGVTRLKGKGKVKELHYDAEMIGDKEAWNSFQTVDLIPHTRFKETIRSNINFSGGLSISGNAIVDLPEDISNQLLQEYVSVGGALNLQLSNSNSFIGKFTYSLKYPVVISTGIASNGCHWVLKPDEEGTPLLGDQLLVQVISVPKGTDQITYNIKAIVIVAQGLLYKQSSKETNLAKVRVFL